MEQLSSLIQDPVFDSLVATLRASDFKLRKQLLTLSRYGKLPLHYGNLLNIVEDGASAWLSSIEASIRHELRPVATTYPSIAYPEESHSLLNEFLRNPLNQGAAIMAIMIYTPSQQQIEEIKLASYLKEINVMDRTPDPPNINFAPFFGDYNTPIHEDVPANPTMAKRVHTAIDNWIKHIGRYIHTPRLSKKLLNSNDRESIKQYFLDIFHEPQFSTQADLELLEFNRQIQLDNPTELRQRWAPNGISPRSFYVGGSSLYYDVRYSQRMWNDLVDSLAQTHRRGRVNPGRIYIDDIKHALFYDLSSFTSNMEQQPIFLDKLALYCEGKEISVMTTEEGTLTLNLATAIRAYNRSNEFPRYYCPALATMLRPYEDVQGVAGFLGVYGNIATCMFLHGAVLLQLAEREDEVGVAGDDAVIVVHYGEEQSVYAAVALCGVLAQEKTFDSDSDVLYLKRRTEVGVDKRLFSHNYVQLPSFLFLLSKHELSRFRESFLARYELKEIAMRSLNSFFSSAANVDSEFFDDIRSFAAGYYDLLGLPHAGHVPQYHYGPPSRYSLPFIPDIYTAGSEDYIVDTLVNRYPGRATVKVREELDDEEYLELGAKGITFVAHTQPSITFLLKLGFLEKVTVRTEMLHGDVGLERLIEDYKYGKQAIPAQYVFTTTRAVPPNLRGGEVHVWGKLDFEFGMSVILSYPSSAFSRRLGIRAPHLV